jgi:Protein of unknown function DUF262
MDAILFAVRRHTHDSGALMRDVAHDALPEEELEPEPEDGEPLELEEEPTPDTEGEDWSGVAPPDRKLVAQPVDLAVSDLVSQVASHDLLLNPVYQRRYVWDDKKASKLVESLLINVPIPVCYLAEEADGTRSTIDGQQRLRSLYRFLNNEFSLRGLEVLSDLNGKRFHQLSDRQQRLIRNRTIRCIVITEESHPDIRFDVFERLNTGSVALTAQELRNSVYRGSLNELLHELASHETFRACLGHRADTRMAFEELVLRFLALDERLSSYRPSFKVFLNHYMRDNRNPGNPALEAKRARFIATVEKVHAVYGDNSFRRVYRDDNGDVAISPAVNSALYDAIMLNLAAVDIQPQQLAERAADIRHASEQLMLEDTAFIDAISLATGDRARLRRRVRILSEKLSDLGLEPGLAAQLAEGEVEEA